MFSHSVVSVSLGPWIVTCQAPLELPSQGYWSGLPSPPAIFPTQGSKLCPLRLLHWQADSSPLNHLGSPETQITCILYYHSHWVIVDIEASLPFKKKQKCLVERNVKTAVPKCTNHSSMFECGFYTNGGICMY